MRRTFPLLALVCVAVLAVIVAGCTAPSVAVVEAPSPYPTYTSYPTLAPLATYTPYPTYTAAPTYTAWPTYTALPTHTEAPTEVPPTATPEPSPIPPTATPQLVDTPTPAPTAQIKASATPAPTTAPAPSGYNPPVLLRPDHGFDLYGAPRGDVTFQWTWDGQLQADEYFQVQIISRDASNLGEHRGIHAPTKEHYATTNRELWGHFRDWEGVYDRPRFGAEARIYADWTVAIVKWDGVDSGKIGLTIVEAEPHFIKF